MNLRMLIGSASAASRPHSVWTGAIPAGRDGNGALFNSIIAPLAHGPMAISGFVWYQGEANTATLACAKSYACLFPAMITG